MKPDAEIYDYVEKQTGKIPSHIMFFDDNVANIEAAKSRGWHATLITQDMPVLEQVQAQLAKL